MPRPAGESTRARPGEPLRASWSPELPAPRTAAGPRPGGAGRPSGRPPGAPFPPGPGRPPARASRPNYRRRRWVAGLAAGLLVLTVIVVVGLVGGGSDGGSTSAADAPPVVREAAPGTPPAGGPTAVLPAGGPFAVSGAGSWHTVPGGTPPVGQGRSYTYTVDVENGTAPVEGDEAFAATVDATLDDPRSWVGSGQVSVRRVDASSPTPPDFRISLTSQMTVRKTCGYSLPYEASCYQPGIGRVVINDARWARGALAFEGQLGLYRQYAINHEVGHAFGNKHVPCPAPGALAPVMMEQSFGTSDDYLADLTAQDPQQVRIPHDGRVCRPDAFPFPQQ